MNSLRELKGQIHCDLPNNDIHKFRGYYYGDADTSAQKARVPLNNDNILLRVRSPAKRGP